ncbi:unnamed protein product [Darwinula stevensoni]|uniref:Uncharacterized protein n=1 Tax=Darwinula stevensoni TaxID=69355 RepID=A0A7R9A6M0_9CRUS|nr:unnamed protein product [Darwinula stevensoni]CAG0888225.1 unnamed protein product [Darwinula stevensoni]
MQVYDIQQAGHQHNIHIGRDETNVPALPHTQLKKQTPRGTNHPDVRLRIATRPHLQDFAERNNCGARGIPRAIRAAIFANND